MPSSASAGRCRPRQARRDPSTGRRPVKAEPLAGCRALHVVPGAAALTGLATPVLAVSPSLAGL